MFVSVVIVLSSSLKVSSLFSIVSTFSERYSTLTESSIVSLKRGEVALYSVVIALSSINSFAGSSARIPEIVIVLSTPL